MSTKIETAYPTDRKAAGELSRVGPLAPGAAGMQVKHIPGPRGPVAPATGFDVETRKSV